MTDTARVLLTAAVLAAGAMTILAWQVIRTDVHAPARLIGQLRLAQFAAMLLSATGAVPMGLAIAATPDVSLAHLEIAFGVIFVVLAGLVLLRDPRQGLLIAAIAFVQATRPDLDGLVLTVVVALVGYAAVAAVSVAVTDDSIGCALRETSAGSICGGT